jgi:hypothetical protein
MLICMGVLLDPRTDSVNQLLCGPTGGTRQPGAPSSAFVRTAGTCISSVSMVAGCHEQWGRGSGRLGGASLGGARSLLIGSASGYSGRAELTGGVIEAVVGRRDMGGHRSAMRVSSRFVGQQFTELTGTVLDCTSLMALS